MHQRLQKALAAAGVASRRHAEELIAAGLVTVNGSVASIGDSADPDHDIIAVSGVPLPKTESHVYLALNKPPGYLSSAVPAHGDPSVLQLVPGTERLFPVGRLDKETSGLLLLTNDGDWADRVTHPRYGVEKEYLAWVRGVPDAAAVRRLAEGVALPNGTLTAPATVRLLGASGGRAQLSITVIEGRKRQIRLMTAAVGHPVESLKRVRVGTMVLGDLALGAWRHLTDAEIRSVRERATDGPGRERQETLPDHRNRRTRRGR